MEVGAVRHNFEMGLPKDYPNQIWFNLVQRFQRRRFNKMNCELMLTYNTPALWQTGSRNLTVSKTLPTIWGTYMKLVTKYQISAINSCWEKCDEKCAYMFNEYKDQLIRQTGSRNLTSPKTLPTIWYTYTGVSKFFIPYDHDHPSIV